MWPDSGVCVDICAVMLMKCHINLYRCNPLQQNQSVGIYTLFRSGLLKWWPKSQIWLAVPLKVTRGRALIKEKYRANDRHHVPVKMPIILAESYTRFYPCFSSLHQMTPFCENSNIKLKISLSTFWHILTILYGKVNQFWDKNAVFWISVI